MRQSVILFRLIHALVGLMALLWLLWYFVPSGNLINVVMTLLLVSLAAGLVWRGGRRRKGPDSEIPDLFDFPAQGPVVLVCGEGSEALFQGKGCRKTAQGWWVQVQDVAGLSAVVRYVTEHHPRQVSQLAVMYVCLPDQHQDDASLRASMTALRQQMRSLNCLAGVSIPVILGGEFSGFQTPWTVIRGDVPQVCPGDSSPVALSDWQRTGSHLSLLLLLGQAFEFACATLIDELERPDRLCPPVRVFAVVLRVQRSCGATPGVWTDWLYRRTSLRFPPSPVDAGRSSAFPDALLLLLAPLSVPVSGRKYTVCVLFIVWLCCLSALCFSVLNNRDLILQVSAELQRWQAIPMTHVAARVHALSRLEQETLLLERWQRMGPPLRYGLGYEPDQRLWLALQQAIDSWSPPAVKVAPAAAQMIRLDSLSLFDSGKAQLRDGSTRILTGALVGIKAKPGWLIVVSGHTDDTGSPQVNQVLSLQRAAAVRDWMRDTGGIPESCFAVQGLGNSRPLVSNNSPEGRALNRRVEISLVPQADACRMPDITLPSSLGDDGTTY